MEVVKGQAPIPSMPRENRSNSKLPSAIPNMASEFVR